MRTEQVTALLIASGLIGFVIFLISYAFQVWRSRNRGSSKGAAVAQRVRLTRFAYGIISLGVLTIVISVFWREFGDREGQLNGDGLFTLRAQDDWSYSFLAEGERVETGDVLATLSSAEWEAERNIVRLRRAELEMNKEILARQPLTLDPELVRKSQETATERRQVRAIYNQFSSQFLVTRRELMTQRLTKRERIHELETLIGELTLEIEKQKAQLQLSEENYRRLETLAKQNLASAAALSAERTKVEVQRAEVVKLNESLRNRLTEKRVLTNNLDEVEALETHQNQSLEKELSRASAKLERLEALTSLSSRQLEEDAKRAAQLREEELKAMELALQQIDEQLSGVERTMRIVAPFSGQIVYRDPAPNAAEDAAPVLVLAPGEGFELQLRVFASEIETLVGAGSVILELLDPLVKRRFSGEVVDWKTLPDDPNYVLAVLRSQPPPTQAIRDLASGETVAARLIWRPPLYATPFAPYAAIAVGLGILTLLLTRRVPKRREVDAEGEVKTGILMARALPSNEPVYTNKQPHPHNPQFGEIEANVKKLCLRFRKAVIHNHLDYALLSAVTWNLDRQKEQTVKSLRSLLGEDKEFIAHAIALLSRIEDRAKNAPNSKVMGWYYNNLSQILFIVAPRILLTRHRAQWAKAS